jgi:hypothetical protein
MEVVDLKVLGYSSKDPYFKTLNTPMIMWLLFTARKCDLFRRSNLIKMFTLTKGDCHFD